MMLVPFSTLLIAALGHVSHLLCMLARYLEVFYEANSATYFKLPLTYKMVPMGSRSVVVDRINFQPGQP
jgi:hypothetical protein